MAYGKRRNYGGNNVNAASYSSKRTAAEKAKRAYEDIKKDRIEKYGANVDVDTMMVGDELRTSVEAKLDLIISQTRANNKKIAEESLLSEKEICDMEFENKALTAELKTFEIKRAILNEKGYAKFPVLIYKETKAPVPNSEFLFTRNGPRFLIKFSEDRKENIWIDPAKELEMYDLALEYEKHVAWVYENQNYNGIPMIFKSSINFHTGEQYNLKTRELVKVKGLSELTDYAAMPVCYPYIDEYNETAEEQVKAFIDFNELAELMSLGTNVSSEESSEHGGSCEDNYTIKKVSGSMVTLNGVVIETVSFGKSNLTVDVKSDRTKEGISSQNIFETSTGVKIEVLSFRR